MDHGSPPERPVRAGRPGAAGGQLDCIVAFSEVLEFGTQTVALSAKPVFWFQPHRDQSTALMTPLTRFSP
jgi:hypothetical protein